MKYRCDVTYEDMLYMLTYHMTFIVTSGCTYWRYVVTYWRYTLCIRGRGTIESREERVVTSCLWCQVHSWIVALVGHGQPAGTWPTQYCYWHIWTKTRRLPSECDITLMRSLSSFSYSWWQNPLTKLIFKMCRNVYQPIEKKYNR